MTYRVTLRLSPSIYRLAQKTAEATSRPLEQVLSKVISSASPVSDDLPRSLRSELESLSELRDAALWRIAEKPFSARKREKYDRLLKKNSSGTINPREREDLRALRIEAEQLMVRKAHAYALLRWRGHSLPALRRMTRPA